MLRLDNKPIVVGQSYSIVCLVHPTSTVTTDNMRVEIRYTTNGTTPTTASPILQGLIGYQSFGPPMCLMAEYVASGSDSLLSLILCVAREAGSGTVSLYADGARTTEMKIYRSGFDVGDTGVDL